MAAAGLGLFFEMERLTSSTAAKQPFGSPILEWKGNGCLYVKTESAQHNQAGPLARILQFN